MSWDALHVFLDARDAAVHAELDALKIRYAALAGAVLSLKLEEVVCSSSTCASATTNKCLMCNEAYDGKSTITARCGHTGIGDDCAAGYNGICVMSKLGPCKLRKDANDCYACRQTATPVPARPGKCLMCDEPYGKSDNTGGVYSATCGCKGVGYACSFFTGNDPATYKEWSDKRCLIHFDKSPCFACRQKK